ncbi:MAG: Digeranylgeranylglycerophospholipid reductase [Methanomassiliicoccales archaeon PtaU1.Bin124]|nr:MAG: Digeranylgeranylglycerophospholipid reductase [Methanomassiliicoccales archaeon PtaU1.Bin124]
MRCDVAVVGGGPVGCFTAANMSRSVHKVVLEEHERVGVPEQCAGLIAPRVVEMGKANAAIINRIDGAVIHFPSGREMRLKGEETKAYVVDRRRFDESCLDQALANGAECLTGHRFLHLRRTATGMVLRLEDGKEMTARLAIGADGYRSRLGQEAGLSPPREYVRGIQVDLERSMEDQQAVDVWLGREIAPGFFAWRIPCGDRTRVGLCVADGTPSAYLKRLIKLAGHENDKRVRLYSGIVPIGMVRSTVADNVMIVGDAAGQVKPISGGGLYPGLTAAGMAGKVASDALEADDLSTNYLRRYEKAWKAELGKGLDRGYRVRKAFLRMDDDALDLAGRLMDTEEARGVLSKGDIDHPTAIARDLLGAAPGLMRFAPQLLASMFSR